MVFRVHVFNITCIIIIIIINDEWRLKTIQWCYYYYYYYKSKDLKWHYHIKDVAGTL